MAVVRQLRSRRGRGRRGDRGPLPQELQTALPRDITAQPENIIGFSLGHVREGIVESEGDAYLQYRKLDGRTDLAPVRADELGARQAIHPQIFNNFRFVATAQSQVVLVYNPARAYLLIQNRGTQNMFIAFSRDADPETAVLIEAGGNYEPILSTVSSVHVVVAQGIADQVGVIVEGFYPTGTVL